MNASVKRFKKYQDLILGGIFTLCFMVSLFISENKISLAEQETESSRHNYVSDEVIVKLKEREPVETLLKKTYNQRKEKNDIVLSRLKAQYDLKDEQPVVKNLHDKLRASPDLTQAQIDTQIKAEFSRRSNRLHKDNKSVKQDARVDLFPIYILKLNSGQDTLEACRQLSNDADVEYAEPNYIARASFVPNDTWYYQQWAHQNTQAENAWDIQRGNSGIVIAVIDTGVDYNHQDLAVNMLGNCTGGCPVGTGSDFVDIDLNDPFYLFYEPIAGEDYVGIDNSPSDYHGHGTHVVGIANAATNNAVGVAGVSHGSKIMPVRAGFAIFDLLFGEEVGLFEFDDIINSINYAVSNGADIISMSLGGPAAQSLSNAIDYADQNGVVLVAAAGNENSSTPMYPAAYAKVIAVAATAQDNSRAYYSNYGSWVDVAAPGGDYQKDSMILSTVPLNGTLGDPTGYTNLQGTSMACPYVAGEAALLLSQDPEYTTKQIKSVIKLGVTTIYPDQYIGTGLVNLYKALLAPHNPYPDDGASGMNTTTSLDWESDVPSGVVTYDLYFGNHTSLLPEDLIASGLSDSYYNGLSVLNSNTTYYWYVNATHNSGEWSRSPEWNFVTKTDIGQNNPPGAPINPVPLNHALNITINTTLNWDDCIDPEQDPVTYDLYFGAYTSPPLIAANIPVSQYNNPYELNHTTTYHWSVKACDNHGNCTQGPLWDFVTQNLINNPPNTPSYPNPQDNATGVSIIGTILSWIGGDPDTGDTVTYDLYFGNQTNPALAMANTTITEYSPGTLNYNTTYYWKVKAWDNHGNYTQGPQWDFATRTSSGGGKKKPPQEVAPIE